MARVIRWGVWFEGSSVVEVADGLSAFREEARWRERGWRDAVAVWSSDGRFWHTVSPESGLRPAPAPPAGPRRVGVAERLLGRWIKGPWLRRRRD